MDDSPKYRFDELRKDFHRLREFLRSTYSTSQQHGNGSLGQEVQRLTTTVESHLEKLGTVLLEGQRSTESRMDHMEQLIRQQSQDNYEVLKQDLKQEKTSRLKAEEEHRQLEQRLRDELSKVTKEKEEGLRETSAYKYRMETQLKELQESLQYSEAKISCLEEKCKTLTKEKGRLEEMSCNRQTMEGFTNRLRSSSCSDIGVAAGPRVSPSHSCVSLSDFEYSDDEAVMDFTPASVRRPDTRSYASVDTHDSAFSESSYADVLQELNCKVEKLIRLAQEVPHTRTTHSLLRLPTIIRGFCVNIQESVSSPDGARLSSFSRSLEINLQELQQIRDYGRDQTSLFWAVIQEWYRHCTTDASRSTMLNKLIQACCDCGVPNPLDVQPMPTTDRQIIEANYSYLVEHLMVRPALIYLRDSQFLSSSIFRYVMEPESDPEPERTMRFVDILPVCGLRALDYFVKALRRSEQCHIADRIVESNPERFAGFKPELQQLERNMKHQCQNIDIEKPKKKKWYKHMKERMFKSKSYDLSKK